MTNTRKKTIKVSVDYIDYQAIEFIENDTNAIEFEFVRIDMLNKYATITLLRPDSSVKVYAIEESVWKLPLQLIAGRNTCTIEIYNKDKERITSQKFYFTAVKELKPVTAIENEIAYPVLTSLIADNLAFETTIKNNEANRATAELKRNNDVAEVIVKTNNAVTDKLIAVDKKIDTNITNMQSSIDTTISNANITIATKMSEVDNKLNNKLIAVDTSITATIKNVTDVSNTNTVNIENTILKANSDIVTVIDNTNKAVNNTILEVNKKVDLKLNEVDKKIKTDIAIVEDELVKLINKEIV